MMLGVAVWLTITFHLLVFLMLFVLIVYLRFVFEVWVEHQDWSRQWKENERKG